jgi:hypothetical protein
LYKPDNPKPDTFAEQVMPNFIVIKLKALFMLTVFTANFYSVCHCKDMVVSHPALSQVSHHHEEKDTCCDDEKTEKNCTDHHKPCNEKDGCCGTHAVKFSLLEKQTAEQITLHPLFAVAFTQHFIIPLEIIPLSGNTEGKIEQEWLHKHSPPDLQSLYQRFLI